MDLSTIIITITLIASGVSVLGWSYSSLRKRLEDLEVKVRMKPTLTDVRLIISDKLEPVEIEHDSLKRRIDELREDHKSLSIKIDQLISVCYKVLHEKE
jgi:hypothetical protein